MKKKLIKSMLSGLLVCTMAFTGALPAQAAEEAAPSDDNGPLVMTDENGNVYDLGGMEIVVRDWWSPTDMWEPSNQYEEDQREYWDWIQETYNFKIKSEAIGDWGSNPTDFIDYVEKGGDNKNYVFTLRPDNMISAAMRSGMMYDLSSLDCLDFSESKFQGNKVHELYKVGDSSYAMYGGTSEPRTGVYFNKRLLVEAGIDPNTIYDMQAAGTWTWQAWLDLMEQAQCDTDCDGVTDRYGAAQNSANLISQAVFSNGADFVGYDGSKYTYDFENTETKQALEFANKVLDKYSYPNEEWDDYKEAFREGKATFMVEDAYHMIPNSGDILDNMEDEIGFVMFPKGPNAADYTNCWSNNLLVIPSCYSEEKAWAIAFAWNLYTNPVPGYEDVNTALDRYSNAITDQRSVTDTIPLMLSKGQITYEDVIPNLNYKESFLWAIYPGCNMDSVYANSRDSLKAAIDAANVITAMRPGNLTWSGRYAANWTPVPNCNYRYAIELWKDGQPYRSLSYSGHKNLKTAVSLARFITESGTYKFRVRTNKETPDGFVDNEWSDFSEEIQYVLPSAKIEDTVGYWDPANPGVFCFNYSAHASCEIDIRMEYRASEEEEFQLIRTTNTGYTHPEDYEVVPGSLSMISFIRDFIDEIGEGQYRISIKQYAQDIDNITHGDFGPYSAIYDTRVTSDSVSNAIDEAIESAETSAAAVEAITSNNSVEEIRMAMAVNEDVVEQIKNLETSYLEEKNITYEQSVDEAAKDILGDTSVEVVGAALNAESGNVNMKVSVPENPVEIPELGFRKTEQIEISLTVDNVAKHELEMPISVTMSVPASLDLETLVLLHYYDGNKYELIHFVDNGDGTIRFTVDKLSTFVLGDNKQEPVIPDGNPFADIQESEWMYTFAKYAYYNNMMNGTGTTEEGLVRFEPNTKLTRAQLVQILYSMEGKPAVEYQDTFTDVPEGQWFTKAVLWANSVGITSGVGEGKFAPNKQISREQVATMLKKYAEMKQYDVSATADLSAFPDEAEVSSWAVNSIGWAVANGIISGKKAGEVNILSPGGDATRAECAAMLKSFCTKFVQ